MSVYLFGGFRGFVFCGWFWKVSWRSGAQGKILFCLFAILILGLFFQNMNVQHVLLRLVVCVKISL